MSPRIYEFEMIDSDMDDRAEVTTSVAHTFNCAEQRQLSVSTSADGSATFYVKKGSRALSVRLHSDMVEKLVEHLSKRVTTKPRG